MINKCNAAVTMTTRIFPE